MKTSLKLSALAVGVTTALALAACSSPAGGGDASSAPSGDLTTVSVATVSGLVGNAAIHLGVEQGIFEKEGLKLDISEVQNPPAGIAAVQGGQVDIAYSPATSVLTALSQGVGLKIVMAADGYDDDALEQPDLSRIDNTSLYATPDSGITKASDLEGKTVSVPARKAHLEVVLTDLMKRNGVDPASVNWVTLDFQSALEALKAGTVDAAGLVDPFGAQAGEAGMVYVASPTVEFFGQGATGLWTTGVQTAEKKKDIIAAFQRGIKAANEYANTHLDEAKAKSIELTGAKIEPDAVIDAYWPLTVREKDIERANKALAELGFLPKPAELKGVILPQP